jgi:uncharacterized protein involved in exopolysaccharide biosynthesis/Mrp family chromosome partitioning ATPase
METFGQLRQRDEGPDAPGDGATQDSPDDTPNFRDILGRFWARRWLIATFVIVCALLAFVTAKLMTPIYTGEALVVIKPAHAGDPATIASVQAAIEGGPEAVPTEAIVLQSRTLARQTVERLHLDRDPEFAPRSPPEAANAPAAGGDAGAPVQSPPSGPAAGVIDTAVVDGFLRRLEVTVEPHSNVIAVAFKSSRPTIAALVPNTLVQIYLDRMTTEKNQAVAQESGRLDHVILPMLRQKMFDSEADRKIYEQYLARSDDAHGSMGQARPDAAVLSAADVPIHPTFPKTLLMVILGAAAGGGIATMLVVLLDFMRGGLFTREQVENALAVRCLGSVPMLDFGIGPVREAPRLVQQMGLEWLFKLVAVPRRRGADDPSTDDDLPPVPHLQPQDSAFGQAVRSIQLKLRSADRRTGSRVILITSALPGEGKTWMAVSLAASLAGDGFGVALVDCDLHRPSVHRLFDGPRAPGLTDYFAGTAEFSEICHSAGDTGVTYVPIGASATKGAWRLTPDRLLPVIERLAEDYAFVILDSAPVLAIAETMLLAKAADKTLLLVKWRTTRAAVAGHALRQLREAGAETYAVLSVVDIKRAAEYGDTAASVYKRLEGYYLQTPRA